MLFISKSYLNLRVVTYLIVSGRSAASAGLSKWEFPQFWKLINVHCDCAFPSTCSNCWVKYIWDRVRASISSVTELRVTDGNFWSNNNAVVFDL